MAVAEPAAVSAETTDITVSERRAALVSRLTLGVAAIGAALRLVHYLAGSAQWLDEIALSRNIVERSAWDLLTTPLAYDQSAPPLFLLVQKSVVAWLGVSDYALRLFPIGVSLLGLFVFRRLALRVLEGYAPIVAVTLFATAAPLIVYSAQVKQYASDVAVAVVLLWLASGLFEPHVTRTRRLATTVFGVAAVWISQCAVLLLAGLGAAFAFTEARRARTKEAPARHLWPMIAAWGISAGAAILVGLRAVTPETRAYLRQFWSFGLLPLPLSQALKRLWPLDMVTTLVGRGWQASLGYPVALLYIALGAYGLVSLLRRRGESATIFVMPIAAALAAAIARQYPFSDRLILFLLPGFFIGVGEAVERLRQRVSSSSPQLGALVAALLVAPTLYPTARQPPPYRLEDVKPALLHMQTSFRAGDGMYVYYGAGPAILFYGPRYGIDPGEYILGQCHRGEQRRYLEELDALRGRRRAWIVLTHASPFFREREPIIGYLDAIGTARDALVVPSHTAGFDYPAVEVRLYDLSDPARLQTATAATFPLPESRRIAGPFGCGRGPLSMNTPPAP
jgi:hypothetical protein